MTVQLEIIDEISAPGFYMCEVSPYPTIAMPRRVYDVLECTQGGVIEKKQHPAWKDMQVIGYYGPLSEDELDIFGDPTEEGYYVGMLQPYPNNMPSAQQYAVLVWRRGKWHDAYGFAKQYGNVIGWLGPFPMLRPTPHWLGWHEQELAEEIGL